jgi:hypothetical protein
MPLLRNLMRRNGYRWRSIDPLLGARLVASCVPGVPFRWRERLSRRMRAALQTPLQPPLFLLGHWRSGTMHLHNLLVCDSQFGYCSTAHVASSGAFLTVPNWVCRALRRRVPTRRPMDNVDFGWESPQEEDLALARLCELSFFHCFFFPERAEEIFRQAVLMECPAAQKRWKQQYDRLLRRLS